MIYEDKFNACVDNLVVLILFFYSSLSIQPSKLVHIL